LKGKTKPDKSMVVSESNRELTEKNQQLQALVDDLKEFTAMVTHDLRTPVAAIKGFAEMLSDLYSSRLDERGRHLLRRIEFNAAHMDNIIRGLRELVLVGEESRSCVQLKPYVVVQTVMENHSKQIDENGIIVEVAPTLPGLTADPAKIFLVFENLLSNSFKYTAKVAKPVVRVGGFELAEEFVFYVEDNGPGVASGLREKVFEVFFQCDKDLPGLGLGLSIVKRVVELYGGRIWVERGELGGARFCFTLPDAVDSLP